MEGNTRLPGDLPELAESYTDTALPEEEYFYENKHFFGKCQNLDIYSLSWVFVFHLLGGFNGLMWKLRIVLGSW